jgi:hypothetical protein
MCFRKVQSLKSVVGRRRPLLRALTCPPDGCPGGPSPRSGSARPPASPNASALTIGVFGIMGVAAESPAGCPGRHALITIVLRCVNDSDARIPMGQSLPERDARRRGYNEAADARMSARAGDGLVVVIVRWRCLDRVAGASTKGPHPSGGAAEMRPTAASCDRRRGRRIPTADGWSPTETELGRPYCPRARSPGS